ncbi:MAG: hypothetical protein R3F49_22245 [Planctomycetota bacterium]
MLFSEALVLFAGLYLALGLCFAAPFAWRGVGRIDPDAAHGTWGFRVLIVPGATLLWPYLLRRWVTAAPPPMERTPHKRALGEARP